MIKRFALLIIVTMISLFCKAQAPQSFRYQAVVRHLDGSIVQNQIVSLRISILPDSPLSNSVYSEWHRLATNEFGIVNIKVGEGTNIMGTFSAINWGVHSYFLKTELDISGNNNYSFIGTSELLSVPYALYAENAVNVNDADADPENEIQNLNIEGDTISISQANSIVLPWDNDTCSNNEIQALSFSNDTLYLQNGGWVYIGHYMDNTDSQTLSLNGPTLTISNGNSVTFNEAVDMDGDPTNEFQFLTYSNDTLYLTNSGFVVLPEHFDWQYSSLIGAPTNISHFNNDIGYITNPNDADADPLNELQVISIHGDTINLSNGGFVRLPTGQNPGDMRYWNGNAWVMIPGGQESQVLMWKNGIPQWQDFYVVGSMGPAGGIVFYDKGFYSDGGRYLELAPKSTEWNTIEWGCYGTSIPGAENSQIGSGEENTNAIVSICAQSNIAASLCYNLVYNGYDDWFLPSILELQRLYNVLHLSGLGSFRTYESPYTYGYWSSTQYNQNSAYYFRFTEGTQPTDNKNDNDYKVVRAIRAF